MGIKEMDKKYYLYMHQLKQDVTYVYIGQTCNNPTIRQGKNGSGYKTCPKFQSAIQEYGQDAFNHIILFSNLTKEEVNEKEKEYIEKYDAINHGFNISKGGNGGGFINHHHTEEVKQILNEKLSGKKNPFYGKHHTEETKNLLSQLASQRTGEKNPFYGKHHTEETKQIISEKASERYQRGNNPKAKKVLCVENNKIYNCCTDAAEDMGFDLANGVKGIARCARGERNTYKNYHQKYIEKGELING